MNLNLSSGNITNLFSSFNVHIAVFFDFSERINAYDALKHPYFKDLNKEQDMLDSEKKNE